MKDYNEIVKELDAKIPRDVISKRDGGGGRQLSYLEGHYVIDRLNKVLGIGNWSYTADEPKLVYQGTDDKSRFVAHYTCMVTLRATLDTGKEVYFTDIGYGDGMDRAPGKCHELAVKESVTDGIKRVAKNLGMSMGLALYDKTQENVEDEQVKPAPRARNTSGTVGNKPASVPSTNVAPVSQPESGTPVEAESGLGKTQEGNASRQGLTDLIVSTSRAVIAFKAMTRDEIVAYRDTTYGVDSTAALTDTQAGAFLEFLKGKIKSVTEGDTNGKTKQ